MDFERLDDGSIQLSLVSEAEARAATLSFSLLNRAVAEGRYQLEGSWLRRLKDENRLGTLDSESSIHYAGNAFLGLLTAESDNTIHARRPLKLTGERDLSLLRNGSRLLLDREVIAQGHYTEQGNADWAPGERHAYGPAFMPALRSIVSTLEDPAEPVLARASLASVGS
ncbi:MAG TPA: hypothetical protein VK712_02655 [Verrucomicrobiae bacterium]|jgi:hypothetical protein|nr:hypothetical protein [Verrucomicrobiae bacterium]